MNAKWTVVLVVCLVSQAAFAAPPATEAEVSADLVDAAATLVQLRASPAFESAASIRDIDTFAMDLATRSNAELSQIELARLKDDILKAHGFIRSSGTHKSYALYNNMQVASWNLYLLMEATDLEDLSKKAQVLSIVHVYLSELAKEDAGFQRSLSGEYLNECRALQQQIEDIAFDVQDSFGGEINAHNVSTYQSIVQALDRIHFSVLDSVQSADFIHLHAEMLENLARYYIEDCQDYATGRDLLARSCVLYGLIREQKNVADELNEAQLQLRNAVAKLSARGDERGAD